MAKDRNVLLVKWIGMLVVLLILYCSWPYEPEKEPYPDTGVMSQSTESGTLYQINPGKQTCNPSISQDTVNYSACMLWLGFSGELNVKVPVNMSGYTTTNVLQHDRLTITDFSNTVKWYIMRDELGVTGHIQDPEWAAHPDYIACLGEDSSGWNAYAIRISDKASLKLCAGGMSSVSTPHIWVSDTATGGTLVSTPVYNSLTGFIDRNSIKEFFGTTSVKVVYSLPKNGLTVFYIDYNDSVPAPIALVKPDGKEAWDCESPLISPEGNWITYNCSEDVFTSSIYIQRLRAGRAPVLVSEDAFEPHWWVDPVDPAHGYYIVYVTLTGSKVVQYDFTDQSVEEKASAGITYKQKLKGSAGNVPAHMGLKVETSSAPEIIARLPFKGGLSPDGLYLCTGYVYTYILLLP